MKQPLRWGHRHQNADLPSATGLTEDRDATGISAEIGDVVPNPLKRRDQIQHPHIGRRLPARAVLSEIQIAQSIQMMVHADNNHIAALGRFRLSSEGVQMLTRRQSSPG